MQSESIHIIPYARRFGGKARDCSDTLYTCAHVARVCVVCVCVRCKIFPRPFIPPTTRTERWRERAAKNWKRRGDVFANHPRGIPRAGERKKSPARKWRRQWHLRPGPRVLLKSSSFFPFIIFFVFRLIVENVKRTKMVSRGTLDALAYFHFASSSFLICSSAFRFQFSSHDPSCVRSSVANEKWMAWMSAGEEASSKVRPVSSSSSCSHFSR